ncbi:MAG: magnesium transporter, partial [Gemmatimonadetes bacterium]|nr:magnesium transporter [Gemmatimonadota bacterium]
MSQGTLVDAGEVLERLRALIAAGDGAGLRSLVAGLHPSDVADLIEPLDVAERIAFLSSLPIALASDALAEVEEEEHPEEILAGLAPRKGAELIHNLPADDAVDLIADLEPEERARLLAQLPVEEAGRLRGLLVYGEETAGGLMTTELVAVLHTLTAREAIEEVRRQGREIEQFYNVFVVDKERRMLGTVPLDDLILADPDSPVSEVVVPPTVTVLPSTDQEEVGRLMAHYNLVSMAVVSEDGRLLGRITFDDVIDVLEQEQTEDILKLAGLYADEVGGGWGRAVQNRLPWLLVNLGTSLLGASVVYVFSRTIQE